MDLGRKLTPEEARECAEQSDEPVCQACGVQWENHHIRCEGSEDERFEYESEVEACNFINQ